jgi:hypothetical protein
VRGKGRPDGEKMKEGVAPEREGGVGVGVGKGNGSETTSSIAGVGPVLP